MRRFVRARPVLLVAAVLFAGLVQFAGLAPIPALIGFAVIALAVVIREAAMLGADETSIYGERTAPPLADRMVDAIIAGLSDPAFPLPPQSRSSPSMPARSNHAGHIPRRADLVRLARPRCARGHPRGRRQPAGAPGRVLRTGADRPLVGGDHRTAVAARRDAEPGLAIWSS